MTHNSDVNGRPVISRETIAEWRALQGQGMTSAIGEYTPAEFWTLLDAYEALAFGVMAVPADCGKCGRQLRLDGLCVECDYSDGVAPSDGSQHG